MPARSAADVFDDFRVDLATHLLTRLFTRGRRFWVGLGNRETESLHRELETVGIDRPVFITGLARAGSTILLEYLSRHTGVATHRYRDFPGLCIPVWWNRFLDRLPRREQPPAQRSHRDGIVITPESPESLEEYLWMTFFPRAHDPEVSALLSAGTDAPAFASFYRDHLRKMLLLRGGTRFVAKNNNSVTRLGYLRELFPDCRFIIPVRDPVSHIASLMKQHGLFLRGERRHPRALHQMQSIGHFEFGLDRRPLSTGNARETREIVALWRGGEEVRGWARYWAGIHRRLEREASRDEAMAGAVLFVPFGELCANPSATLGRVSAHCALTCPEDRFDAFVKGVRYPAYYAPEFTAAELEAIAEETGDIAARLGLAGTDS